MQKLTVLIRQPIREQYVLHCGNFITQDQIKFK